MRISPRSRQAFLLTALEGFTPSEAAQILSADPRDVERLIASDVGLSYKLLRAVQTANFYTTKQVSSLAQAIVVLGRDQLIRILSLITLSRFRGRPAELIRNALHRARLCELLAAKSSMRDSGAYFMVGLLSLMPAMLGEQVEDTLGSLPLAVDVQEALLKGAGDMGAALACVMALEQGEWSGVAFRGLSLPDINAAYVEACGWVEESIAKLEAL